MFGELQLLCLLYALHVVNSKTLHPLAQGVVCGLVAAEEASQIWHPLDHLPHPDAPLSTTCLGRISTPCLGQPFWEFFPWHTNVPL